MKKVPPFKLTPEPLSEEARRLPGFQLAADDIGTRHRLGGEPEPAMNEGHWPRCPECSERMSFYGQLDSLNDEFCIADTGRICVFLCFGCNEVKATIESA
jgi:hypothetical protein